MFSTKVMSLRTDYKVDTMTNICETIINFSGECDSIKQTLRP